MYTPFLLTYFRALLFADFWRHYVLSGGTQRHKLTKFSWQKCEKILFIYICTCNIWYHLWRSKRFICRVIEMLLLHNFEFYIYGNKSFLCLAKYYFSLVSVPENITCCSLSVLINIWRRYIKHCFIIVWFEDESLYL